MSKKSIKADLLGAITSILCLIHCSITPILFMTWTTSSIQMEANYNWWYLLDYLFLVLSFVAIYSTTKKTSKRLMKIGFWSSWFFLTIILLNEKLAYFSLPESIIFLPTASIILLHTYSLIQPFTIKNPQMTINHTI